MATFEHRRYILEPVHVLGSLAVCRSCGDLIREHRGHVFGRCTANDDLNALLAQAAQLCKQKEK